MSERLDIGNPNGTFSERLQAIYFGLETSASIGGALSRGAPTIRKLIEDMQDHEQRTNTALVPSTGAVGWPHADDEAIRRSLEAQREQLINLPKNWDGYGAGPLMPSIVDIMLGDIETEGCLAQLVPGSDGSLQAEWHLPGVTVEYDITVDGKRHLYVVLKPAAPPSSPSDRDAALKEAAKAVHDIHLRYADARDRAQPGSPMRSRMQTSTEVSAEAWRAINELLPSDAPNPKTGVL
jgi:hypothetical protein